LYEELQNRVHCESNFCDESVFIDLIQKKMGVPMNDFENKNLDDENEIPEIYSLKKGKNGWQISRRDFLKAAGAASALAAAGIGNRSRLIPVSAAEMNDLCKVSKAHNEEITAIAINSSSTRFVSGDESGEIKVWTLPDFGLENSLMIGNGTIRSCIFNIDSTILYVGTDLGSVFRILLETMEIQETILTDTSSPISCMAISKNGNMIALSNDEGKLFLYDNEAGKITAQLDTTDHSFVKMNFSADAKTLYTCSFTGNIRTYSVPELKLLDTNLELDRTITAAGFIPGDIHLIYSLHEGGFVFYSLPEDREIWAADNPGDTVFALEISPDGSLFITSGTQNTLKMWSTSNGELISEIFSFSQKLPLLSITPDGTLLISTTGKSILVWSLPDGKLIQCPVDLSIMPENEKAITIEKVDEVTGKTITFTLPCGSPLPAGAVCVCNCVGGSLCSCDAYTTCSCDSHSTCSCVGHTVTYSYHYWHPN
jgi:WD40 repeat protein